MTCPIANCEGDCYLCSETKDKCYMSGCAFTAIYATYDGKSGLCWRCGHDLTDVLTIYERKDAKEIIRNEHQASGIIESS